MSNCMDYIKIAKEAYGKKISDVKVFDDEIFLTFSDDSYLRFYHQQDCCEDVYVEDIDIDLHDLIGSCLHYIEEASKEGDNSDWGDSTTWTFYKIQTSSQCATVRWYGLSNGYYSESVDWHYYN